MTAVSAAPVILVIEDEVNTRRLMQVTLAQGGYHTVHTSTGASGVAATFDNAPNAVLLDLGLPDLDGVEVTRRIRQRSAVPIMVVSARGKERDKVEALDNGANDYVTKPFGSEELLARIRVLLRNGPRVSDPVQASGRITSGDLSLDFDLRTVTVGGVEVYLTKIEFSLLATMMASPGRVLTHQQILSQVWGPPFATEVNYLRVYMKKLRHKIEPEPARPRYLVNEPGIGYRLRLPNQSR